ncbi:substrate-binding domain-containing protein [Streptomyces graminofaciens]|uniref:substrate-binding domain-containing protein n=1 Tax=Streptomyces graminofaciens TaxID=68212 RepID=UPI0025741AE0|nr:substrate-binding domain-containing protein [Streptomyces graminofaciens]
MRRIAGIVLAVLLIGGVVAAVVAGRDTGDKGTATKTVHGVIGSEKAEFFADPEVVKALAAKGYTVKTETSGSWAMEGLDLKEYDFAFPSSQAPAEELAAKYKVRGTLPRPFYSPLVVVAHRDAAEVLRRNGLAKLEKSRGTFDMTAYLKAAEDGRTWQQLKGAEKYGELTGLLYIATTDPTTSNSGALYLAATSFVANGGRVVAADADVRKTAPLLHELISVQGAQQTSTDAAFRDFVSGVGNPLVLVYESQVAALLNQDQGQASADDLVVLYPDTTVNSDHTVVPVTQEGRALGELLGTDPTLRKLAARHGFRPQGAATEFTAATADHTTYLTPRLAVRQAPVPTSEVLHEMARRARGQ